MIAELQLRQKQIIQKGGERRLGEHSKRSPSLGWSLQLGVKPRRGARNRRLKLNQQLTLGMNGLQHCSRLEEGIEGLKEGFEAESGGG